MLVNFNLVNTCVLHATPLLTIMHAITHRASLHMHELACLAELILAIYEKIRQFAKLKSPQKFPAVRYAFWS